MSTLADRLRGVLRPAAGQGRIQSPLTPVGDREDEGELFDGAGRRARAAMAPADEVLGGQWRDSGNQQFLVVDRKYSPGHRHGRMTIADCLPPQDSVWPMLPLLASGPDGGLPDGLTRALFVDLETTGLAGGAGTYAFLVGCAWFDGGTFRVRQFFLSSYAAERALLQAVSEITHDACVIVTYNGKSFDLPLIETRYLLHRMVTPFAGLGHVDMLHPARRLWRADDDGDLENGSRGDAGSQSGCRLTALEATLCGHVREGDVPGFEIPSRYFHYVRTGDSRRLDAVLEHNRQDLISLALITVYAAQLIEDGPGAARTCREALGLGRLYERAGRMDDAKAAFARAAAEPADTPTRAEALRAYAVLCRRDRSFDEAATAWRRILELKRCSPQILREATEALAVHHEHRLRDPQAARTFALRSLQVPVSMSRRQALQHRLARLDRKLSEPPAVPLF